MDNPVGQSSWTSSGKQCIALRAPLPHLKALVTHVAQLPLVCGVQLPSKFSASYVVAGMGVVWAMMGGALLLATEQIDDPSSRWVVEGGWRQAKGWLLLVVVCLDRGWERKGNRCPGHKHNMVAPGSQRHARFLVCPYSCTTVTSFLPYLTAALPSLLAAPPRLVYYTMSGACFTVGAFTTHGLAGYLRYSAACHKHSGSGGGGVARWHFWQPFQGGATFVATQVSLGQQA